MRTGTGTKIVTLPLASACCEDRTVVHFDFDNPSSSSRGLVTIEDAMIVLVNSFVNSSFSRYNGTHN